MSDKPGVRVFSVEDYVAWADDLASVIGADWLDAHAIRPHRHPHVIAGWLLQHRNTPPEGLLGAQHLLKIGELMSNIQTLQNAGTQNLQSRIDDLRLDDQERVASAIHEIRVAAGYALSGRRVFFIPEAGIQTPDLLVDDCSEVECKHKSGVGPKDKARFELYRILHSKLRAVYPEHITHAALLLDAMFAIEPRRDLVNRIVATARSGLRRSEASSFVETAGGLYTARFEVCPAGSGPTQIMLPRGVTEFDQRSTEAIALDDQGTFGRFINLNVGCEVRQDRVKSIIKSIRSAARQFSGRYPATVSVDISAIAARSPGESLAHLRDDILDALKSHTTISRVELSTTHFFGEVPEESYGTSTDEIDNPDARFPIG